MRVLYQNSLITVEIICNVNKDRFYLGDVIPHGLNCLKK